MFMTTFRSIQTRRNVIREGLKLCKERRERRHLQNDRNIYIYEHEAIRRPKSENNIGRLRRPKNAIICSLYEARGSAAQMLSKESIGAHKDELKDDCRMRPLLSSSTSDLPYVQTQYGEALLGSVLSYQCAGSMDTFKEQVLHAKERGIGLIELLKRRGNSCHNLTIHLCLLAIGLKKP